MSLTLYFHPFSSFCQKVLIALYENATPFQPRIIDLSDSNSRVQLERLWPVAKFPVLRDEARQVTVPETSLIIEYLARHYPGPVELVPADPDAALPVQIWDRFFDNYVHVPMQKAMLDRFRPEGANDPHGVTEAKDALRKAYAIIEAELGSGDWIAGNSFTLADCAAAPALFYSNLVQPFAEQGQLSAYFSRLMARPSFARAVDEARPFRHFLPLTWPSDYG
jgi:glutathione S-transferase